MNIKIRKAKAWDADSLFALNEQFNGQNSTSKESVENLFCIKSRKLFSSRWLTVQRPGFVVHKN